MTSASNANRQENGELLFLGAPITLGEHHLFEGCNAYHATSVIRQRVDFGALADADSTIAGKGFAAAFLERFGGLDSFFPNNGLEAGLIERLSSGEGVPLPDLLLEAVLAVENCLAYSLHELSPVSYAAVHRRDRAHDLVWASTRPAHSREAARIALPGLLELFPRNYHRVAQQRIEPGFEVALSRLREKLARRRLAPSTAVIKYAATRRGIPCRTVGRQHLLLGEGARQHRVYASMTGNTSIAAQKVCADKRQTNRRLAELRLPAPRQFKVGSVEAALNAARKIGFPVAVKPLKGKKGFGVTLDVKDEKALAEAFSHAHERGSDVVVERFLPGRDYRLLVIGGRFVAAVERRPPVIVGDGSSSIDALLDELNADRYRDGFRGFRVERDEELARQLARAGLSLDSVLEAGRELALRQAANVSSGGIAIDVTDRVHDDHIAIAERAAKGVGLDVAGVDIVCPDISRPHREAGGGIIEINARPGLDLHVWPKRGASRNVADAVLDLSFPDGDDGRVPSIAVVGDKGTGTTARFVDRLLRGAGYSVALALRLKSWVDGRPAELSEEQQKRAPLVLTRDPEIEALVSTVSPRQTARRGMLLEQCRLAIVLDRVKSGHADLFHAGLDIVDRATRDVFVVGAGNRLALDRLKSLPGKRLVLVGERLNDPALRTHLEAGGAAVAPGWVDGKRRVLLLEGGRTLAALPFDLLPPGVGDFGKRRYRNALLFSVAAAHGLGLSPKRIQAALEQAPAIIPESD